MKLIVLAQPDQLENESLKEGLAGLSTKGNSFQSLPLSEFPHFLQKNVSDKPCADRLVVAGGDGSLNAAVNALLALPKNLRPPVVHLPMGTANDFYTSYLALDHPSDLTEMLQQALLWPVRWVDAGLVNDRYFINVATGGSITQLTTEVNQALKNRMGKLGYYINGLMKASDLETYDVHFRTSDWQVRARCVAFSIGNGSHAGGGFTVAPDAYLDDDRLDLLVVYEQSLSELGSLALDLLLSEAPDLNERKVTYKKVKELWVESDQEVQINLDGEPIKGTRFHFQVVREAVPLALKDLSSLKQP